MRPAAFGNLPTVSMQRKAVLPHQNYISIFINWHNAGGLVLEMNRPISTFVTPEGPILRHRDGPRESNRFRTPSISASQDSPGIFYLVHVFSAGTTYTNAGKWEAKEGKEVGGKRSDRTLRMWNKSWIAQHGYAAGRFMWRRRQSAGVFTIVTPRIKFLSRRDAERHKKQNPDARKFNVRLRSRRRRMGIPARSLRNGKRRSIQG